MKYFNCSAHTFIRSQIERDIGRLKKPFSCLGVNNRLRFGPEKVSHNRCKHVLQLAYKQ